MAIYIPADMNQPVKLVNPKNGIEFTLDEMHDFVEGYIEAVRLPITGDLVIAFIALEYFHSYPLTRKHVMWVNENGYELGKEINERASSILSQIYPLALPVVGNVLIATLRETGDED